MHGAHDFLSALAIVLGVAALTTVVFQRLRQPVVLGYILAGLIIGPHVPIPLVADPEIVRTLSELGVILLMFSIGLEFSFRKLFHVGPTAAITAVVQCSLMLWLGFATGRAFGWTTQESIFTGAVIAISSTTIIVKAFDEQNVTGKLRELVIGILVVEDLIAIMLMATLTALATGRGVSPGTVAKTTGRLVAFLVGFVAVGLVVVPRTVRSIQRLKRPETTLIASISICFASALLAREFGYSVALGAFIAGSLVAESGEEKAVEQLVAPVRDLFAAIFFVSVGMMMDPGVVARFWLPILALTTVVVLGKVLGVALGAFLTGNGARRSIQAGMSLAQIGEFSFIIAGLGLSLGATRSFLYPIAVAISLLTTLFTPSLIRASSRFAASIDGKLPSSLQTFAALYASWLERLGSRRTKPTTGRYIRRLVRLLVVDATCLAAIFLGTALALVDVSTYVARKTSLAPGVARGLVVAAAGALSGPFCVGIVRVARRLGATLTELVFPRAGAGKVDVADAPRRALLVALQITSVLLVGAPLVALTQPFLPGFQGAALLLVVVAGLGLSFWRTATNLEGHVRAGAEVVIEALARQSAAGEAPRSPDASSPLDVILEGLGEPITIDIGQSSPAAGQTLAELNLRGVTGATVLAITRGGRGITMPGARERVLAGDVLAIAGTRDSLASARLLLSGK